MSSIRGTIVLFVHMLILANNSEKVFQKISPDEVAGGASFSRSVSVYDNYALIGAFADDDKGLVSGSAFVFEFVNKTWKQTAKLTAEDGSTNGRFGVSVSIHDNRILVGAEGTEAAYVFELVNGKWKQTAKLTYSPSSSFGSAVAIHDKYALIAAIKAVYVFELINGRWVFLSRLISCSECTYLGMSVSIDSDYAIIGVDSKSAYIFELINGTWKQAGKLIAADDAPKNWFGFSVCINNAQAFIGAYGTKDKGYNSGAAYVFELMNGDWLQTAKLSATDGAQFDRFGISVSCYNNHVLIGAFPDYGAFGYIFGLVNGSWTQKAKLTFEDGYPDDVPFGAVSIYDDFVVIGVRHDDGHRGAAYITKNYNSCDEIWDETNDKLSLMDSNKTYLINYRWTSCTFSARTTFISTYNEVTTRRTISDEIKLMWIIMAVISGILFILICLYCFKKNQKLSIESEYTDETTKGPMVYQQITNEIEMNYEQQANLGIQNTDDKQRNEGETGKFAKDATTQTV